MQMILRADSGMDFIDMFNFLHFIASKRIRNMKKNTAKDSHSSEEQSFIEKNLENCLCTYDLKILNNTIKCIVEEIKKLKIENNRMKIDFEACIELSQHITSILNKS